MGLECYKDNMPYIGGKEQNFMEFDEVKTKLVHGACNWIFFPMGYDVILSNTKQDQMPKNTYFDNSYILPSKEDIN